jgi:hypothetical protein
MDNIGSVLKSFEQSLLVDGGLEADTHEIEVAKSMIFYALKKWQNKSMLEADSLLYFLDLCRQNESLLLGNVIVLLEHLRKIVNVPDKEIFEA